MEKRKCIAKTKTGKRCNSYSMIGSDYCFEHNPTVESIRKAAKVLGGKTSKRISKKPPKYGGHRKGKDLFDNMCSNCGLNWGELKANDFLPACEFPISDYLIKKEKKEEKKESDIEWFTDEEGERYYMKKGRSLKFYPLTSRPPQGNETPDTDEYFRSLVRESYKENKNNE